MHSDTDRALALAGVLQSALLTQQAARRGAVDGEALRASLYSVFQFDAPSVAAVFDGPAGVRLGLEELGRQLGQPSAKRLEVARYALSLLHLERKLAGDERRLAALGAALGALQNRLHDAAVTDPEVVAQLAEVYRDQISTLTPRIMVNGDPDLLRSTETGMRIRACLLAGIRAARLWRQCGGRHWHLALRRGALAGAARQILRATQST
jgi:high frequency lysogenization protein